jgi:hypothetical protein
MKAPCPVCMTDLTIQEVYDKYNSEIDKTLCSSHKEEIGKIWIKKLQVKEAKRLSAS